MKHLIPVYILLLSSALAEPKKGDPIWTDPAKATTENPDFKIQGEYSKDNAALQVVALGKGQFQVSAYKGGLPGAGWDKSKIIQHTGDAETINEGLKGYTRTERKSPTLGQAPPKDAIILFDGKHTDAWEKGKITDGLLESGTQTKDNFGDFQLHLEFRLPFKPETALGSQDRGNSGVYTHYRYETQILDSFGVDYDINSWETKPPSDPRQWCGCLYKFKLSDTNMSFPPLTWQTYDITFTAAKFDGDKKTKNARISVLHNGVKIHNDVELPKGTGAGGNKKEIPSGPIVLQGHGNPVRYQNIWIIKK